MHGTAWIAQRSTPTASRSRRRPRCPRRTSRLSARPGSATWTCTQARSRRNGSTLGEEAGMGDGMQREGRGRGGSRSAVAVAVVLAAVLIGSVTSVAGSPTVGPQPDGSGITPQGWIVTPAGSQTDLGPNPLAVAMSPRGDILLTANGGYESNSLMVV